MLEDKKSVLVNIEKVKKIYNRVTVDMSPKSCMVLNHVLKA